MFQSTNQSSSLTPANGLAGGGAFVTDTGAAVDDAPTAAPGRREPITFRVDGLPKGQPRARAFARNGKARMYDPGTAEGWKQSVVASGDAVKPLRPFVGPIRLSVAVFMPRPKRLLKRNCYPGTIPHIGKPDADNLAKAIMDAMTVAGWWGDDAQVYSLEVEKFYHALGARSGAMVTVYEWTKGEPTP